MIDITNQQELFEYLTNNGYTAAAVKYPEIPKNLLLTHLELSGKDHEFKEYYREFIESTF